MALLDKFLFRGDHKPPDKQLWADAAEFDSAWKRRISKMAAYVDVPGPVADFGCGMMWLEGCLGNQNSYFPIDYIRRDERTLVLDFNKDPLPPIDAPVAFLSGSLEYVRDTKQFIQSLMALGFQQIVLSYCTIEKNHQMRARKALNWESHESIFTLLELFCEKYDLAVLDNGVEANTILVFRRKQS